MENDIKIVPLQCKKQGCNKCLSDQERLDCEKMRILPLCSEHVEWARTQMAKCAPLFQKIKV